MWRETGLAYIGAEGYHSSVLADWYIYQHDGDPLGPWSTDAVAEAILAGGLAPDVWVAAPGGPRWLRALDVPVIGRLVDGIPTKPRRDSGLRIMPHAYRDQPSSTSLSDGTASPGSVMSASSAPATIRTPDDTAPMHAPLRALETREDAIAFAADDDDDDPPTDPIMPPSSDPSTPSPPRPLERNGAAGGGGRERLLEAPVAERGRRRKNG